MSVKSTVEKAILASSVVAFLLAMSSCAALQPSDVNGPRSNLPAYPIVASDVTSRESGTIAWHQLAQRYGVPQDSATDLQPLTGTIRSLPSNSVGSIFLPKVGSQAVQTEEEIRESLRRFITDWQRLIGADPHQLSLVERTDSGPVKIARYEQRPFRYALRGGFGNLTIQFQSDRRVVNISSTCIPDTDRLQTALNSITPLVTAEEAGTFVKQQTPSIAVDPQRTINLPPGATFDVRQLVVYAKPTADGQTIELHLAWEIDVTNGPIKTIYLDAISRQIIAVA